MPIAYYSMPFCKPPEGVHRSTATINPGTILLGIRIENSPYNFTIMVGVLYQCWVECLKQIGYFYCCQEQLELRCGEGSSRRAFAVGDAHA